MGKWQIFSLTSITISLLSLLVAVGFSLQGYLHIAVHAQPKMAFVAAHIMRHCWDGYCTNGA